MIYNALLVELGVDSRIGCTFGDVYCGPVGGSKRNEYAVMGRSCNLAARLMSLEQNSGILVDNAVRQLASSAYVSPLLH
jgi:class 3 adenylate cyclase